MCDSQVSVGELEAIFRNPRVHLNKGYKRREHMPLLPPPPAATIGGGYGGGGAGLPNGRGGEKARACSVVIEKLLVSCVDSA
jgi:hypothetical protein